MRDTILVRRFAHRFTLAGDVCTYSPTKFRALALGQQHQFFVSLNISIDGTSIDGTLLSEGRGRIESQYQADGTKSYQERKFGFHGVYFHFYFLLVMQIIFNTPS
jgi:hypothetical protein